MQQEKTHGSAVVVRRVSVEQWVGLSMAARLTGRTVTQIKRHIDGVQPSRKLQADMDRLGVVVER